MDGCNIRKLFTHVVEVVCRDKELVMVFSKVGTFGELNSKLTNDGAEWEWAGPIPTPTGGVRRKKFEKRIPGTSEFK